MTAKIIDFAAFRARTVAATTPAPVAPAASVPAFVPAYCDPANERRGTKFERGLSTKEIAARVRAEIKAATKRGELPAGLKVSVRYESFAGGSAIRVNVTAWSGRILNEERLERDLRDPHSYFEDRDCPRYTAEATALLEKITSFSKAYHRDNSDTQVDYFDVNFYGGDAGFDWRLESAERAAFKASHES